MKLLVGLGNPGEKYKNNRHNVGYMFVDYLENKIGKKKDIIVAKTQVFMNESGRAVNKLTNTYNLEPNTLYIIHDDLDIRLGEYKIQKGKGPKLHNGIESIEQTLQTKDFWRVRIGVDNRDEDNRIPGEKYVLQDFVPEEKITLKTVFEEIVTKFLVPLRRDSD